MIWLYLENVSLGAGQLTGSFFGWQQSDPGHYWFSLWLAFDMFCNALAGGDYRETISSRAAKARLEGRVWGCVLCAILRDITGGDHCTKALDRQVGGNAVIPD